MNLYDNVSDTKALAGMLYGMNPKSVITYPASAEIAFGKGIFLDSNGKVSTTKSTGKYVGVALFHQCEGGKYYTKDAVACMNDGAIWVVLASSVTPSDGVNAYVKPDGTFTTEASDDGDDPTVYDLAGKFKSGAESGLALVDLTK